MSRRKIPLNEEIVMYVFPGMNVEVEDCENGAVVKGFKRLFPEKLGIFIPGEVERSNYSSYFPKPFESYFSDFYEKTKYLSRLLEIEVKSNVPDVGVEFISGKVLTRDDKNYTIFQFNGLPDSKKKTDILCRAKCCYIDNDDKLEILNLNPKFLAEACDYDNTWYLYWISPIGSLFGLNDELLAAIFNLAGSF